MDKSNGASPYNQNKGLYDETPGPAIYDPAMFEPVFTDSTPNTLQPVEMPFTNFEPMRGDHRQVGASYPFPPFILDIPQYLVPNVPEPSRVNIIGGFVPPLQTYNHPRPPEPAVLPAYHANMIQHTPLIGSASTSSFNMPFELHNPDPQLRATPLSAHSIHLLETNFRDPIKLELRNFLHLVLTSPWFHADELEPQNDSQQSVYLRFLHRSAETRQYRCLFDHCHKVFDRQDRALGHIRGHHLGHLPFACPGGCLAGNCAERFCSLQYLQAHRNRRKVICPAWYVEPAQETRYVP